MTITTPETPAVGVNHRFNAVLGTGPDGAPVTVHARGHILLQGRTGSGKSVAFEHLAAQWSATPGAHVITIRYVPRDRVYETGHWGWRITNGDISTPVTYEQVLATCSHLADQMRGPVPERPGPPTLLLVEEVRLTSVPVVDLFTSLLINGRAHGLSVVLGVGALDALAASVRRLCATTIFMDPAQDHTTAAADAVERARRSGLTVPAGPGSFIVANDRCDVGRVPWQAPGAGEA